MSWVTRARVRGPAVSTSCPGRLKSGSRARGFTSWPGRHVPGSEIPWVRPAILGDSGLGQTSRDVDQLSQTIRNWVRGTAVLTRCPGDSGPGPVPTVSISSPGRIGLCRWAHGVDQLSRATCARVRVPAGSTRSPWPLGPLSKCPRGRLAVPGDSGPGPRDRGVDKLSWVTRAGPECPRGR